MNTLLIDIETAPNIAATWKTGQQYLGAHNIIHPTRVLCFAWKWRGYDAPPAIVTEWGAGKRGLIRAAHSLLDQADAVVHYNGERFDTPHLNRAFLKAGLTPPSPFQQVDVYRTIRKRFNFPMGTLEYVARELGLDGGRGKVKIGMEAWLDVVLGRGDKRDAARAKMERYCCDDVSLLEELYELLTPWALKHPNAGLYVADDGTPRCPACGSEDVRTNGSYKTGAGVFPQYRCHDCGRYCRSAKREATTPLRELTLQ